MYVFNCQQNIGSDCAVATSSGNSFHIKKPERSGCGQRTVKEATVLLSEVSQRMNKVTQKHIQPHRNSAPITDHDQGGEQKAGQVHLEKRHWAHSRILYPIAPSVILLFS